MSASMELTTRTLIVTGASCAGKTSVAHELNKATSADRRGAYVYDIDDVAPPPIGRGSWLRCRLAELLCKEPGIICGVVFPTDLIELLVELDQPTTDSWPAIIMLDVAQPVLRARYLERGSDERGAILNEYAAERLRYQVEAYRFGRVLGVGKAQPVEVANAILDMWS